MSDESKELLHRVLRAMPVHQRIAFLREVASTLDPEERKAVFDEDAPGETAGHAIREPLSNEVAGPVEPEPSGINLKKPEPAPEKPNQKFMIENQMKRLAAQHGTGSGDIRRQFAGCVGLGLLLAAIVVFSAVMGKEVVDWVLAAFN